MFCCTGEFNYYSCQIHKLIESSSMTFAATFKTEERTFYYSITTFWAVCISAG